MLQTTAKFILPVQCIVVGFAPLFLGACLQFRARRQLSGFAESPHGNQQMGAGLRNSWTLLTCPDLWAVGFYRNNKYQTCIRRFDAAMGGPNHNFLSGGWSVEKVRRALREDNIIPSEDILFPVRDFLKHIIITIYFFKELIWPKMRTK